jgi:glycerol-3-phosphate dehydrogenase (NAD(P)+)
MSQKIITIIGSGMMGSALAFPASENGNEVRLVGTPLDREIIDECRKSGKHPKFDKTFPDGIKYYQFDQWKTAVEGADFVIGGVSSFGVDWFLDEVLSFLNPSIPVLSVTKGLVNLEDGTLISYPDYWERGLAKKGIIRQICAIGGPCTSYELVFHDQTEVAFCGQDSDTLRMMKQAMGTDYYHISLTNDVIGLESAVALKNGYALAVAMTIGLVNRHFGSEAGLHYNSQAGAFYQAVKEMRFLLEMQGASRDCENIGIGDLYVTVYGGRTRKVGILLGEGKSYQEALDILSGVTLESLVVARRVYKAIARKAELGLVKLSQFPMLCHVAAVLDEGQDAELPWNSFTFETLK